MARAGILVWITAFLVAPAGFSVAVAQCDADLPVLVDFDFNPKSIDVTGGDQTVTLVFDLTDDVSGIDRVGVQLLSPSTVQTVNCNATVPVSGTPNNGTYECVATIPRYSESGNWIVDQIGYTDLVERSDSLFEDDLIAMGLPSVLQVASVPDVLAPVLTGLTLSPVAIDVGSAPGQVNCNVSATDNLAGITFVSCTLTSPGQKSIPCVQTTPSSGTNTNGTFDCVIPLPRYAENAVWDLSVELSDAVDNTVSITTQELTLGGLPDQVAVTSVPDDLLPPVLLTFDLQPLSVNVENADRTVTCTAQIADVLSGTSVFGCSGTFIDGASILTQACSSFVPDSGTPINGTWSCDLTIPQYSPGGTWGFVTALFIDAVGNAGVADSTALQTAGFPASFDVVCGTPGAGPGPVLSWVNKNIISWLPINGAVRYPIYGASTNLLVDIDGNGVPDGGYGLCRISEDPDPTDVLFVDLLSPPAGTTNFILIGYDTATGTDLGLGSSSGGSTRLPTLSCP